MTEDEEAAGTVSPLFSPQQLPRTTAVSQQLPRTTAVSQQLPRTTAVSQQQQLPEVRSCRLKLIKKACPCWPF